MICFPASGQRFGRIRVAAILITRRISAFAARQTCFLLELAALARYGARNLPI
ncbi:hypothetical protein Q5Y75_02850 [Ruegeria sp. 2205SS24-7]|uniref:hypothetical protein n=1 Tax=Ruegeria discodermiae TaxID=3064389 RepID=UPI00274118D8|nr:hypothetical protein [Ruegeria sp. 2205SS24-7]MDP5216144.1 hypothetical protein [Ruegeria sp. 2205SS24-7]